MATTQNTLIVIGDSTITASMKPALVNELREACRAAGKPLSWALNRAGELWMNVEAPVCMAEAKQAHRKKVSGA